MSFLRFLIVLIFLFIAALFVKACYVPYGGPEIYGGHISCHWNGGYDDYMWIFQMWVDHPIAPDEVREVNIFLYDSQGNKNYIPLEYSNSTLWKNIPKQQDTTLECGRWYLIEVIAFDNNGLYDYIETSYQKDL